MKSEQRDEQQTTILSETPGFKPGLLPTITCSECGKSMASLKSLNRHHKEQHSGAKKFKCELDNCSYVTYREISLHDHQLRMHFVPTKQGRTKKNEQPLQKRCRFNKKEFESRYKNALGIIKNVSSKAVPEPI